MLHYAGNGNFKGTEQSINIKEEKPMYQYYKGLLIREGIEGIAPELLRGLYEKLAGAAKELPSAAE